MRLLIVTATPLEVAPLVATLGAQTGASGRVRGYRSGRHEVDVLETGVGMVPTAVWVVRTLAASSYDLAVNLGVCGTFDRALPLGAVVHVTSERMPELGAEDGESFLTLEDLGLTGGDAVMAADGRIANAAPPANAVLGALPEVRGITVNTVHGNERTIAEVVRRLHPQVESMEGAAFMYACSIQGTPFAEVRAVSNRVERRARERWRMRDAIANLCETARQLIEAA